MPKLRLKIHDEIIVVCIGKSDIPNAIDVILPDDKIITLDKKASINDIVKALTEEMCLA
jgi:hypothetical protein